jgi:outer membrane lipoprotein-sorting protein
MRKALALGVLLLLPATALALSAQEVMERAHRAFYYQGKDFKARVLMRLISKAGRERLRELVMLRKNYPQGRQKYYIYFFRPVDVRGMSLLIHKHPGRDDDRWLFIPALGMVKRVAARDKHSSFAGSDFTYEDVSGRDPGDDTHVLLRREPLQGRPTYVIKSTPKEEAFYTYKISWIDQESFLPLKEEYYGPGDRLLKVFSADKVEHIQGLPTVLQRTMRDAETGHRTEVSFTQVRYNQGLKDALFSERYLRRPPMRWLR